MRKDAKRRLRNRAARSVLKTLTKKFRAAAAAGDPQAGELYKLVQKRLDQTASKKIIHANKAARLKSRLAQAMRAKSAPAASPAAQG